MEICNYFGVNPYQIMSSGSMMIAADDGHELVRKLEQAGIHAVVVGRTNNGNDRILRNGCLLYTSHNAKIITCCLPGKNG